MANTQARKGSVDDDDDDMTPASQRHPCCHTQVLYRVLARSLVGACAWARYPLGLRGQRSLCRCASTVPVPVACNRCSHSQCATHLLRQALPSPAGALWQVDAHRQLRLRSQLEGWCGRATCATGAGPRGRPSCPTLSLVSKPEPEWPPKVPNPVPPNRRGPAAPWVGGLVGGWVGGLVGVLHPAAKHDCRSGVPALARAAW